MPFRYAVILIGLVWLTAPVAGQSIFAPRSNAKPSEEKAAQNNPPAAGAPAKESTHIASKAVGAPSPWQRPQYQPLRHMEDWSGLAGQDLDALGDPIDSIKYIPMSDDGKFWASLGGHLRARVESWGRFNFGTTANDDDAFTLVRMKLHSDLHFGDNFRVFFEGKTAGSTQRSLPGGHRTLDVDSFDLEQAFFDLKLNLDDGEALVIRGGRQQLLFGKQRLVSPLPWSNTERRWDTVMGILHTNDGWKVSGFYSQFAPVQKYRFNDPDSQTEFSGVYATNKKEGVDLYWLFLDRGDKTVTFNGTTGDEERHTVGGRLFGKLGDGAVDYDIEGAYQFGKLGTADISAYMIAIELGLSPRDWPGKARLHVGFDVASGDKTAGDNDVETFNQLFPLGHAFFGYMDTVGRQNIIDLSAGLTIKPIDKLLVKLTGHLLWRAEDTDAFYGAGSGAGAGPGGGVIRGAGAVGTSDQIGQEVDLLIKYPISKHVTGVFGYSRFFAGTFLEQTGSHRDVDFVYLILQYTF